MSKNIFLLAAWYLAGGIISSLYNKKKPGELKKEIKTSDKDIEKDFKIILDNFIDTHQNLLEDLKTHVATDENKKLFEKKKKELLWVVDSYKKQWIDIADELKVKWKEFLVEASDNLEKLYEEKKEEIENLKEAIPEKANEVKKEIKKKVIKK